VLADDIFAAVQAVGGALGDEAAGQSADQIQQAVGADAAKALADAGSIASGVGRLGTLVRAFALFLRGGGTKRKRALLLFSVAVVLIAVSVIILRAVGWPAVLSFLAAAAALTGSIEPLIKASQAMQASQEKAG